MKAIFTLNTQQSFRSFKFFILIFAVTCGSVSAQKWSGVNGNEWLEGKYTQPWVKLGVSATGIHKVLVSDLPQVFKDADKTKLALWHRGKQVSIIKADATEILFYGVPNDGASDSLLYRLPTTRKNLLYSTYSDRSAYFLTVNPLTNGNRAVTPTVVVNPNAVAAPFHVQTYLKKFVNEYSHSTATFYRQPTFNSYFEEGKQATGTSLMSDVIGATVQTSNPKSVIYTNSYVPVPFSFQVKSPSGVAAKKVTVHIKSRLGASTAEIFVGKASNSLRSVGTLSVSEVNDYDFTFNLLTTDYDATGLGTLGFKSTRTGTEGSGFSISYFTIEYEQLTDMQNLNTYKFVFPAVASGTQSTIALTNVPADVKAYNITDPDVPQIISGSPGALRIDRNSDPLTLLATKETVAVAPASIETVSFQNITPRITIT